MWAENNGSTFRKVRKIIMQILTEENPADLPEFILQSSSSVYST